MNRFTTYEFRGQQMSLRQISALTGIHCKTLLYRYNQGETMDEAASRMPLTPTQCGANAARIYRERANA